VPGPAVAGVVALAELAAADGVAAVPTVAVMVLVGAAAGVALPQPASSAAAAAVAATTPDRRIRASAGPEATDCMMTSP
jgi:hypothetical protein